eukprot:TRINITY_DN859_c1_g1_i1.p1 TRINITY_DN859_c1_g1~~TRINITY_DN859_c1_g1_i1.p1  ORF type:complete len:948 (+),score=271.71 TRINITY_DN859_c1_g1_i1:180-3023(+)
MKFVLLVCLLALFASEIRGQLPTTTPQFTQTNPTLSDGTTTFSTQLSLQKDNQTIFIFHPYPFTVGIVNATTFLSVSNGYTDDTYENAIRLIDVASVNADSNFQETTESVAVYFSSKNQTNSGLYMTGSNNMIHLNIETFRLERLINIPNNFAPKTSWVDQKNEKSFAPNQGGTTLYEFDLESFNETTTKNYTMPLAQVLYNVFDQERQVAWLFNEIGEVAIFNTSVEVADNAKFLNDFTISNTSGSNYAFRSAKIDFDRNFLYVACQHPDGASTSTYAYFQTYQFDDSIFTSTGVLSFVREKKLDETAGVNPTAIYLDENGGQAFVGMVNSPSNTATWSRYDLETGENLENTIYINNGNPILFDISTNFNQTSLVVSDGGFSLYEYPSSCPGDCSYSNVPQGGYCDYGTCVCLNGFTGDDCSQIACSTDCGAPLGHGSCNNGVCLCGADWTGDNCQERRCPLGCSSNGDCNISQNYTCTCNFRWEGNGCNIPRILSCEEIPEAAECTGRVDVCGWCHSSSSCHAGNAIGPVHGACADWFVETPKDIGIMAFAIIYIIICGILVLINIISAAVIDYTNSVDLIGASKRLDSNTIRRNWWRDERSNMGWALFEQLQFISLYAIVTVKFPTRILSFTRYFDWTCFVLPLPKYFDNEYNPERSTQTTTRSTLSYEQYGNGNNSGIREIWYAQMVWLCLAFAAATVLYLIYALISLLIRGSKPRDVYFSRLVHMWIRMLTVAYYPLVLIAAAHTRYGGTSIVGSIAVLIIFGLGIPALSFFVTFKKKKQMFKYDWRAKFGVVYSTFHFKKPLFELAVLAKKAVLALVIGFMAAPTVGYRNQAYGQVAGAMFVMLVWVIAIIVVKPYLDKTHLLLECALNILNIISIGMALTHVFFPSLIGDIIFILLQIIGLLVCVGAFIHCWLAMENVNCCAPKGGKEEENTTELETHKM